MISARLNPGRTTPADTTSERDAPNSATRAQPRPASHRRAPATVCPSTTESRMKNADTTSAPMAALGQEHSTLSAAIRAHFAARVRDTAIARSPFPHMVIESALPTEIYQRVLATASRPDLMPDAFGDPVWTRRLKFKTWYDRRFQRSLAQRARNPQDDRLLWQALAAVFTDVEFLAHVLDAALPDYLALRFGDARRSPGFWQRLQVQAFTQRHAPGYRLEAHTDIPTRVATIIFSFADSTDHERAGTLLLRPKDPLQVCSGNLHYPLAGFELATIAPYRPNTALLFFKTRHSWHAVSPEAHKAPNGRYGMQVQLYEPDGGVLNDLSEPDLLRNKQFKRAAWHTRIKWRIQKLLGGRQ
ncbi:hypothetical protein [uncultured Thiohalocapsa sp.]|uniref:2OG-Fe(II) oxygenase n=1 Tax=uncultured Thiohalocapsa sp. TaxID=768990 RepID=UPI0025E41113|nr:hypothetical protein [uncultured Thiohalocapsa sp.]